MKRFLIAAALVAATFTTPALAADVGVSLSIGQPGFYGRLDIGDYPQPQLIYRQPIIIERRVAVGRPPVYLHVPPGHRKNWVKHCSEYNACGEQVLFVRQDWYDREYVPRYQERNRAHSGDRRDEARNDDRGNHKDKRKGKGNGKGKGH